MKIAINSSCLGTKPTRNNNIKSTPSFASLLLAEDTIELANKIKKDSLLLKDYKPNLSNVVFNEAIAGKYDYEFGENVEVQGIIDSSFGSVRAESNLKTNAVYAKKNITLGDNPKVKFIGTEIGKVKLGKNVEAHKIFGLRNTLEIESIKDVDTIEFAEKDRTILVDYILKYKDDPSFKEFIFSSKDDELFKEFFEPFSKENPFESEIFFKKRNKLVFSRFIMKARKDKSFLRFLKIRKSDDISRFKRDEFMNHEFILHSENGRDTKIYLPEFNKLTIKTPTGSRDILETFEFRKFTDLALDVDVEMVGDDGAMPMSQGDIDYYVNVKKIDN